MRWLQSGWPLSDPSPPDVDQWWLINGSPLVERGLETSLVLSPYVPVWGRAGHHWQDHWQVGEGTKVITGEGRTSRQDTQHQSEIDPPPSGVDGLPCVEEAHMRDVLEQHSQRGCVSSPQDCIGCFSKNIHPHVHSLSLLYIFQKRILDRRMKKGC